MGVEDYLIGAVISWFLDSPKTRDREEGKQLQDIKQGLYSYNPFTNKDSTVSTMTVPYEQKIRSQTPATKSRAIPRISLHDYEARKSIIQAQIIEAAENSGFFILVNQASPSVSEIEEVFDLT